MRWAKQQRLRFIADRVLARGRVNRHEIQTEFGISQAQASVDLRDYQRLQPGVVTYDASAKAYVRAALAKASPAPSDPEAPSSSMGVEAGG